MRLRFFRLTLEEIKVPARKKADELSHDLIAQNQAVVDKLSGASYDEVDRTYIGLMLKNLPKILSECRSTADGTQHPELKAFSLVSFPRFGRASRRSRRSRPRCSLRFSASRFRCFAVGVPSGKVAEM